MEIYTLNDFRNVLCLRNQLILSDIHDLIPVYENINRYYTLLDTIVVMSQIDQGILLFKDDYVNKLLTLIGVQRFSIKDVEIKEQINELIRYLNSVLSYDFLDLMDQKIDYREKLEYLHGFYTDPEKEEEFLYSLAYDAVVFDGLIKGEMQYVEEDEYFLYSTQYLMAVVPQIFRRDKVYQRTIQKLGECEEHMILNKKNKRTFHAIEETIQKIKRKE